MPSLMYPSYVSPLKSLIFPKHKQSYFFLNIPNQVNKTSIKRNNNGNNDDVALKTKDCFISVNSPLSSRFLLYDFS